MRSAGNLTRCGKEHRQLTLERSWVQLAEGSGGTGGPLGSGQVGAATHDLVAVTVQVRGAAPSVRCGRLSAGVRTIAAAGHARDRRLTLGAPGASQGSRAITATPFGSGYCVLRLSPPLQTTRRAASAELRGARWLP